MSNEEIKKKILFNNQRINELLDPSIFVLQPEVQELLEENELLQTQCTHQFENGVCVFCGKISNP